MKVLLVNGSPHEKGCTYTALKEVSKTLEEEEIETKIFWIGKKPIASCIACETCSKTNKCIFNDLVDEFRNLAKMADGFIFGSAVHHSAPTGMLTSFMSRVFFSDLRSNSKAFWLKPVAAVLSTRRAGSTAAFDQINFFLFLKCQ